MIPGALKNDLLRDIAFYCRDSSQNQIDMNYQQMTGHLCALIDMASVTEHVRKEIKEKFAEQLYPLIISPSFHELTPLGAHLLAPAGEDLASQQQLFDDLAIYNSDIISAWITSTLPAGQLAQHLQQATFAYDEESHQYLLRYYDPFVIPILHDDAPLDWQHWFFAPIYSWWFARASAEREEWHKLTGQAKSVNEDDLSHQWITAHESVNAPKLIIDENLWQTLSIDPLAQNLLKELEAQGTAIFRDECRGIRLAQIEQAINQAHQQGFSEHRHVCEYVWLVFHYFMNNVIEHENWNAVKQRVLNKQGELIDMVQTLIVADNKAQFKLC